MAFSWARLTAEAHTRLWEHFNTLADALIAFVGQGVQEATLAAGYEGHVTWVRTGNIVSVTVAVRRNGGDIEIPAWSASTLATGLPAATMPAVPGALSGQWGVVHSNGTEASSYVWAFGLSGGSVNIQARWTPRRLANGTWYSGTFTYHSVA